MNEVYGHAKAKRVLDVLINRSQERYYKKCVVGESDYPERLNCLIVGPSGTGKTHLLKTKCREYDVPLLCIDATELMPTGNDSGLNRKQLKKLIMDTAKEYASKPKYTSIEGVLNQMIVFVDEFDKLGVSFDSSGNWNKHVQANFLTMIENKEDLSGVSWVFAGAFSSFYTNRGTSSQIGFFSESQNTFEELTDQEIIKAGIIPEMMGRIPLIVELDEFTIDDYANIINTMLTAKYKSLKDVNVSEVAEKAMISGQGVRSIIRQLEMTLIEHEASTPWVMPSVF